MALIELTQSYDNSSRESHILYNILNIIIYECLYTMLWLGYLSSEPIAKPDPIVPISVNKYPRSVVCGT